MDVQMSTSHQTTYDAIFQHPIAHNLQWRDVRSMLNSISEVEEEHNGNLRFMRHGETLMVHPPKHKDLSDSHQLMQIRHFLERSAVPEHQTVADGTHLLVVIDHREARIYQMTEDQLLAQARAIYTTAVPKNWYGTEVKV